MQNRIDLNQALANCLNALERNEWSLKECLDRYPQHREELSSLLGKLMVLRSLPVETPREEYRKKSHQSLLDTISNYKQKSLSPPKRVARGQRKFKLVQVIAAAVLAFVLLSGSVAYASNGAAPGGALYGLDRAIERILLRLTQDEEKIVSLRLHFAAERLEEVEDLVAAGDIDHALEAAEDYETEMSALANLVADQDGFNQPAHIELVTAALSKHREVLYEVMGKVPEKAQQAIQKVLDKNDKLPGFLKDHGKPENKGKPDQTGKPEKTDKPEKTEQPD